MVLPMRPEGTDNLSEADLAGLVTRDAMIGVAEVVWSGSMNTFDRVDVAGPAAPPRSNGEVVFDTPWQQRVFALSLALN